MADYDTHSSSPDSSKDQPTDGWPVVDSSSHTQTFPAHSTPGPHHAERTTGSARSNPRLELRPVIVHEELPQLSGYQLLEVIGRGGMGTVYRAIHRELNRIVAVKLIHSGGRDHTATRLRAEREIRSLTQLEHPNIVPVYDAGVWQGFPFYTMRYVPGGTLAQHLTRVRADLPGAVRLLAKVARAVHRLHAGGVLHRDLKPMNILLGERDEPLVADFGLARWLDDDTDLTLTGSPVGTRQYMAPEQTLGSKSEYGPACDIWALGVILYEFLAGERPFVSDDPVEMYRLIRESTPAACRLSNPATDGVLEAIARKCLQKQSRDRYATADELASDLERWVAGEAVTITLATQPAPPRHFTRRSAVAACLGLAALGSAAWGARRLLVHDGTNGTDALEVKPPERSIQDRLAAGETVTLVGDTGLPLVPYTRLPGTTGTASLNDAGFLTLNSAGFLGIELVTEPISVPFRFEAEIAFVVQQSIQSQAGLFVGHQQSAGPRGPQDRLVQLVQSNRYQYAVWGLETLIEIAALQFNVWDSFDINSAPGSSVTFPIVRKPTLHSMSQEAGTHWCAMSARPSESRVAGSWNDSPLGVVTREDAKKFFEHFANPPAPQPIFGVGGTGLGLCVTNSEAVFRNVRLVPARI